MCVFSEGLNLLSSLPLVVFAYLHIVANFWTRPHLITNTHCVSLKMIVLSLRFAENLQLIRKSLSDQSICLYFLTQVFSSEVNGGTAGHSSIRIKPRFIQ